MSLAGVVFGSTWNVTVIAADATAAARARALRPAVDMALAEVDRQISAWNPESELSAFNRAQTTAPVPLTQGTALLLRRALALAEATDGAFDPTLGPLLALWGFAPSTKGTVTTPPPPAQIAAARVRTGWRLLHLDGNTLRKDREDAEVDLTALGDGAAAAAVLQVFVEHGFAHVLVDVAGEIAAVGAGPKGAWQVGINTPSPDAAVDAVERVVPLDARGGVRALSTSGTAREAWEHDGRRYPHILDPRTAAPITHELVSCTILGEDIVTADALSTACMVLGEEEARAMLGRFPGYEALFLRRAASTGGFVATSTAEFPSSMAP